MMLRQLLRSSRLQAPASNAVAVPTRARSSSSMAFQSWRNASVAGAGTTLSTRSLRKNDSNREHSTATAADAASNARGCPFTHSTATAADAASNARGCPFTGKSTALDTRSQEASTSNPSSIKDDADAVPLVEMPSLPYVGSFYLRDLPDIRKSYQFWIDLNKRNGPFYSIGLPGLGSTKTSHGTLHVITCPREMMKVVRDGGRYPSGLGDILWMNRKWSKDQTDLLHPDAARGYLPGIVNAARFASRGAPLSSANMNQYLNLCAFDMFSTLMFCEYTRTAERGTNPNVVAAGAEGGGTAVSDAEKENIRFIRATVQALSTAVPMARSPYEGLMGRALGIPTSQYKRFDEGMRVAWEVANRKIAAFMERKSRDELSENERASYLNRAVDRHGEAGDESEVTLEEVLEIAYNGIFAAVDTTSGVLGWNVTHLSRLPEVQEKLYRELKEATAAAAAAAAPDRGGLAPNILDRNTVPYLHAVVRESHRLTPASSISVFKTLQSPVSIHGVQLEAGDAVALETRSTSMDPALVDDPDEFRPERWLPDAVEARRGTPRELIDHAYLRDPFSQGARRCPGSRVASNEIMTLLAQLTLDWKFRAKTSGLSMEDLHFEQRTTVEVDIPELVFEPRISVA